MMSTTSSLPRDPTAVHTMFSPNRRGNFRRDSDRRQKAHRIALESIRADVDTTEPESMYYARGADLKKAQQEEDRMEYTEKCNRKLVDKMMMIMQGLCGTIVSEQTFPDFNPGTLNYRIRQREMLRIDRDNLALMHRLEGASSGYTKELVKPKHFQEPHMGVFPRSQPSVKSAGSRSRRSQPDRKRKRARSSPSSAPSITARFVEGGASITSALTEPSAMIAAGNNEGGAVVTGGRELAWLEGVGKDSGMPDYDHNGPVPRIPQPPVGSTRATCGSATNRAIYTRNKALGFVQPTQVKPGGTAFRAGVKISDHYVVLTVTRVHKGFHGEGMDGFLLEAYAPAVLSVYTLYVPAVVLPTFTRGSRTAVRHLFQTGEVSRRRWETVASCLELRPTSSLSSRTDADTDRYNGSLLSISTQILRHSYLAAPIRGKLIGSGSVGESCERSDASAATTSESLRNTRSSAAGPQGSDSPRAGMVALASEAGMETGAGDQALTPLAAAAAAAAATAAMLRLVLVPPADASIITIQSVIRGALMRRQYRLIQAASAIIQIAIRAWKQRLDRRRSDAATKICAVGRGKITRVRLRKDAAARGIQGKTRTWLKKRGAQRKQAAITIQTAVRRRNLHCRQVPTNQHQSEGVALQSNASARRSRGLSKRRPPGTRTSGSTHQRVPHVRCPASTISDTTGSAKIVSVKGRGVGCPARAGVDRTSDHKSGTLKSGGRFAREVSPRGKASVSSDESRAAVGDDRSWNHERSVRERVEGQEREGGERLATVTSTPTRERRPNRPSANDLSRSPYNRPRRGWTKKGSPSIQLQRAPSTSKPENMMADPHHGPLDPPTPPAEQRCGVAHPTPRSDTVLAIEVPVEVKVASPRRSTDVSASVPAIALTVGEDTDALGCQVSSAEGAKSSANATHKPINDDAGGPEESENCISVDDQRGVDGIREVLSSPSRRSATTPLSEAEPGSIGTVQECAVAQTPASTTAEIIAIPDTNETVGRESSRSSDPHTLKNGPSVDPGAPPNGPTAKRDSMVSWAEDIARETTSASRVEALEGTLSSDAVDSGGQASTESRHRVRRESSIS